jgi:hypothetical protein
MAYSRTHYGTGYYIYHQYVGGARLSQPLSAWKGQAPDPGVLDLINRAGTDLAPADALRTEGALPDKLAPKETRTLLVLNREPTMIRKLGFSVPLDQALAFGRAWLRITWDDRTEPSVYAPMALFYGAGTLYNRDSREYLVKAFPSYVRFGPERVELACFFPMPFFKSARIELIGAADESVSGITWEVRYQPLKDPPWAVGYFHATYRDHPNPELGQDLVLLDTRQAEGRPEWSGSFVGTSFIFSDRAFLGTLEGDPRFFFDDSQTPQAYGTGTEEWGGGGDYWGGRNMTLPFAGHPVGARNEKEAKDDLDKIESGYRFLLADLMPFGKNAIIRLEHGGLDDSREHYQTVAYWYGAPEPALVKTDEFKVGDAASEVAHGYVSPQACMPYEITSRYEWGVDTVAGAERKPMPNPGAVVYPPHTDHGRKTTGTSEFTLQLTPANYGVLLRRKLDYALPNQRAQVFVADASKARGVIPTGTGDQMRLVGIGDWKPAGTWYTAGANTCVYSNPKGELGATEHIVQTSNRRFRDDEFLLPRSLTEGRSAIRIRIQFTPVRTPLFPGHPVGELAWSEIRYDAYCFELPNWRP